jgi:L,D-transpeptidase ErfK/SrfK
MTTTLNRAACATALFLVGATLCAAAERAADVLTGGIATHVVARGDTLFSLAARLGVDVETLAADNGLDRRQVLTIGQRLTVDNRHIVATDAAAADIVVNLPQRMLFFFEREVVGLPVAVGRRTWPTPRGEFRVVARETDPTWDVPASIRDEARRQGRSLPASVPPGPANPLGRFWIGLTGGAIGVHGTNAPSSIYGAVTHGCMRLHPDDVAWLFPRVQIGMTVRTVYEPLLLADVGGQVFLEVHPDVYRRAPISLAAVRARAAERGLDDRIDWTRAARVVALQHGVARDVTAGPPARPLTRAGAP